MATQSSCAHSPKIVSRSQYVQEHMLERIKKAYFIDFALKDKYVHGHFTPKIREMILTTIQYNIL